jgi:hypothetical protein
MRSNYIIDHSITEPIVKWVNDNYDILDKNNYLDTDSNVNDDVSNSDLTYKVMYNGNAHEGIVYGKYHLEQVDSEFVKLAFPYDNLHSLEKEIKTHYNLPDANYESYFGILLIFAPSCLNSYKALEHIDDNNHNGEIHTRFNIMLSRPIKGGYAIIEDNIVEVEENEPWICVAGLHKHSTVKMQGDKNRIMLSFGYWYPREFLESRGWIDMYKKEI